MISLMNKSSHTEISGHTSHFSIYIVIIARFSICVKSGFCIKKPPVWRRFLSSVYIQIFTSFFAVDYTVVSARYFFLSVHAAWSAQMIRAMIQRGPAHFTAITMKPPERSFAE